MARKEFPITTIDTAGAPSPATSGTTATVVDGSLLHVGLAALSPATSAPTKANSEVIDITDITGDVITFTRAQNDTTAQSVADGWRVYQGVFGSEIDDIFDRIVALESGGGGGGGLTVDSFFYVKTPTTADVGKSINVVGAPTFSDNRGLSINLNAQYQSVEFPYNTGQLHRDRNLFNLPFFARFNYSLLPTKRSGMDLFARFGSSSGSSPASTTIASVGFYYDGSTAIYAYSASGTAKTTVDISSSILGTNYWNNTLEIEYIPSTHVKFWINGVLVATITTNLPTGTIGHQGGMFVFKAALPGSAAAADISVFSIEMWR